jgi:hypothetical protein
MINDDFSENISATSDEFFPFLRAKQNIISSNDFPKVSTYFFSSLSPSSL